ncbi:MAG: hypothetical protein FJX76_02195 [Armatimonadetes bacterium]|nr:hypothetical protein [Armatimonadota bacterium]
MFTALTARCRGCVVVSVSHLDDGSAVARQLADSVDEHTAAVVADVVDNRRGIHLDLELLAKLVRARNPRCRLVMDGSQAYGQLPELPACYDFLLADLKKWCGLASWGALASWPSPRRRVPPRSRPRWIPALPCTRSARAR